MATDAIVDDQWCAKVKQFCVDRLFEMEKSVNDQQVCKHSDLLDGINCSEVNFGLTLSAKMEEFTQRKMALDRKKQMENIK